MIIDGIDRTTGEIMKPYETPQHLEMVRRITVQAKYVTANIRDGEEEKLSSKNGDQLIEIMITLAGYYEELGKWLAHEKLHIADLKTSMELKKAQAYCDFKASGETNETARMKALILCGDDQKEIDRQKNGQDSMIHWKKAIGKYHDTISQQINYEKSLTYMNKRS